jgi:mRNA interferase HicA
MDHRQVFAEDNLRLVIDGGEGTGQAGVDADEDHAASQNATDVFDEHNRNVIVAIVNSKQFKKWLGSQGATFAPGKGGHLKVTLNGKRSVLPMGSGELKKGTHEGIKKQLGLKE